MLTTLKNLIATRITKSGITDRITAARVREVMDALVDTMQKDISFNTAITFDCMLGNMGTVQGNSNFSFSFTSSNAIPYAGRVVRMVGDGVHEPIFPSGWQKLSTSANYDKTLNKVNQIFFFWDGSDPCYVITTTSGSTGTTTIDTTAPTVSSRTATDLHTIRVIFSEAVNATTAGWTLKKNGVAMSITGLSGSGTNTVDFTVSDTMVSSDTLTASYDSTTGVTKDIALNPLASFTNQGVTNSIVTSLPALNTPGSFAAGTPTSTGCPLTWTDTNSSPNEASLQIQITLATDTTYSSPVQTLTPAANAVSASGSGLTAATNYRARIRAKGDGTTTGDSPWSADVTFTTGAAVATIATAPWWIQYDFNDSASYTTTNDGTNDRLYRIWNQKNKAGYPTAPQSDSLEQATAANRPIFRAAQLNGRNCIELNEGTNSLLIASLSVNSKAKPITRIMVIQPKTIVAGSYRWIAYGGSAAGLAAIVYTDTAKAALYGGQFLPGTTTLVVNNTYIITGVYTDNNTTSKIYVNGNLEATGDAGTGQPNAVLEMLGRDTATTATANVWVFEDLVLDGQFSPSDFTAIHNELKTRYSIS